jgi:hypothetical protein
VSRFATAAKRSIIGVRMTDGQRKSDSEHTVNIAHLIDCSDVSIVEMDDKNETQTEYMPASRNEKQPSFESVK